MLVILVKVMKISKLQKTNKQKHFGPIKWKLLANRNCEVR